MRKRSLRILFDPNSKEYATNAELERDLRDSDRDVYGRTIEEQERDRDSTVIVAVTVALT